MFAVNQANTIYGLVFIVLAEFPGFQSEKWFFKLAAQIRASDFVPWNESDPALISAAFREVADNRLPRLLCISLVSVFEACLEDVTAIELAARRSLAVEEAASQARKLMRKAVADYLVDLDQLGLTFVTGTKWHALQEIVATRNVLVHRSQLVADATYVRQAGDGARAALGEPLEIGSSYFYGCIIAIRAMLYDILAQPDAT
jgi:hypothetical protein